jgi:hypothetical protein
MAAYKAPPGVLLYSGAGTASQIGVMSASLDGGAVADDPLSGETAVKDLPPKPAAVTAQATQPTKSKESSRPKKSQRIVARARDDRSRTVMTFQPDYSTFGRWWN